MKPTRIAGQPSWQLTSSHVEAAVTQSGGQLAPVHFRLGRRTVSPFSVAPWAEESAGVDAPPIIQALRGDFFCAPFGGNETRFRNESHPPHGESANAAWRFESLESEADHTTLALSLNTGIRTGRLDKTIQLRQGQTAIYCRHVISKMRGPMSFGHHAMLKFPDQPGSGCLSTSPIHYAEVAPLPLEDPAQGGYSSLKPGATFRRLDRVPSVFGGTTDVSRYPARRGFEDLLMLVHSASGNFAWSAVTFPGQRYVWFALKDPTVLQSTVLWLSNGGRHYPPWNGRHVNVMGVEDVTSYFHYGLAESVKKNSVNSRGFSTFFNFDKNQPLPVNYIMGVAGIPPGFQKVKTIRREPGRISLISTSGQTVTTAIDVDFLYSRPEERRHGNSLV